jgi:hypothetical protein
MKDDKKNKAGKLGKKNKLETAGEGAAYETAERETAAGSRAGLGKKIAVASAAVAVAGAAAAGVVAVKRRRASASTFTGPEGETGGATVPNSRAASEGVADELGAGADVGVEENETVTV